MWLLSAIKKILNKMVRISVWCLQWKHCWWYKLMFYLFVTLALHILHDALSDLPVCIFRLKTYEESFKVKSVKRLYTHARIIYLHLKYSNTHTWNNCTHLKTHTHETHKHYVYTLCSFMCVYTSFGNSFYCNRKAQ